MTHRDGIALSAPAVGRLLAPVVGYVKRRSAQQQADAWNALLDSDAVHGPDSAYTVEVSQKRDADGTWKLIWRPTGVTPGTSDVES